MRTSKVLITLLALGLAGLGATAAFAAASGNESAQGDHPSNPKALNRTADRHNASGNESDEHRLNASERQARHAELRAARQAALDSFHENRTAAIEAYHAALNATRASFQENKTALKAACGADDDNATSNETRCMRDGMKPLIEKARAGIRAAQETFRARMHELVQDALAGFRHAKADIDARHGRSG